MRARLVSAAVFGLLGVLPLLAYEVAVLGVPPGPMSSGVGWLLGAATATAALVGAAVGPRAGAAPHVAAAALWGVAVTFLSVGVLFVGTFCTVLVLDSLAGQSATVGIRSLLSLELWGVAAAAALVLSPFGALGGAAVRHLARRGGSGAEVRP